MDANLLKEIGLTNNEITVYLALLKSGSVNAGVLVRETSLHRSRVYESIGRLMEKGLVTYVIKNNVKFFEASEPERLLTCIEEQKNRLSEKELEIKKIIPELKKQISPLKPHAEAHVLYGKDGFKTMRKDVLKQKQDIYLIGGKGKEYNVLKYFFPQFNKERIKLGIKWRILADYGIKGLKTNKELQLAEIRALPKGYSTPAVVNIYADRVVNVLWKGNEPICFMLINRDIADSYRKWFELLWGISG